MSADPLLLRNLAHPAPGLGGPSALFLADGRIVAMDAEAEAEAEDARVLDAGGLAAVPGFIELQLNGIAGSDFTSDPASMWSTGPSVARYGVTAFVATIITSRRGSVEAALDAWTDAPATAIGAMPLGVHVEGPFISTARAGAHPRHLLREPDIEEVRGWLGRDGLRILTIAPELPGAMPVIGAVRSAGAVVSVGHTDADADTTRRAIDAGATYATHLFNAMPPLGHRAPGAAGALLADPRVSIGLIVDGHHLDPTIVELVSRVARGRISLVSDAIAALGLPEGTHRLGEQSVTVRDGVARLADGTLAGSAASLDACVRNMAAATGSRGAAVEAVTSVPARILGLDDGRGSLVVGGRADITLLDEALRVRATMVAGEVAFDTGMLRES